MKGVSPGSITTELKSSHLCCVDSFQGLQVFEYDLNREFRPPQFDNLHWSSMMSRSGIGRLNSSSEVVLDSAKHDSSMIDGIDLSPKELT